MICKRKWRLHSKELVGSVGTAHIFFSICLFIFVEMDLESAFFLPDFSNCDESFVFDNFGQK